MWVFLDLTLRSWIFLSFWFLGLAYKMQTRFGSVGSLEEGKEPAVTTRSKTPPLRVLQLFGLFLALCVAFSMISIHTIRHFGTYSVIATVKSNIVPCDEDEPTSLDHWRKPPSYMLHSMSDEELLWRASFMPRIKKYPFNRVPKIAFMFLTKGPLPLSRLWERFFDGHQGLYSVYVHSLPSFEAEFPPSSVFYRRQIPSQVCYSNILNFVYCFNIRSTIIPLWPGLYVFLLAYVCDGEL